MVRLWTAISLATLVLAAGCAPATQPVRLGPYELAPPIVVTEAKAYVDGRCIGLTLLDAQGEEVLTTVVRNTGSPGDGSAYRPIKVPCGAVLAGTLQAVTGKGQLLSEGGPGERDLVRVLRGHLRRLPRSERDSEKVRLIEEAVVLIERGCEPSN